MVFNGCACDVAIQGESFGIVSQAESGAVADRGRTFAFRRSLSLGGLGCRA
jgi:hypothetical protein